MSSLAKIAPPPALTIPAIDGTLLSYYVLGTTGPSLIVLPGAMSSALTQLDLATALSPKYTVYLFSRRSRGLSGPYPTSLTEIKSPLSRNSSASGPTSKKSSYPNYDPAFSAKVLETDLEDLATLMRHTGATNLLGISGGALLLLAALLPEPVVAMPPITKAIIFEPPLLFPALLTDPKSIDMSGIQRYEQEIADGDVAGALLTAMKTVQLGPGWMAHVPRWILKSFSKMIMNAEAKQQAKKKAEGGEGEGVVTMEALAPVLRYDFALCEAMVGEPERWANVGAVEGREILLLGGELSMGYIKEALKVLEEFMVGEGKAVKRVKVPGAGHELLENKVRNGKVEKAVGIIKGFLEGGIGGLQ
jgi:pimeloyl-ACP methyl ester carboxylesterase